MIHERQERAVHLPDLRPVGAVLIRHVQVVALIAPRFVEDLLVFLFRIDERAELGVQSALSGLWWRAIRVDEEESWAIAAARGRASSTSSTRPTAGSIQQLVAVEADVIVGDAGDERRIAM